MHNNQGGVETRFRPELRAELVSAAAAAWSAIDSVSIDAINQAIKDQVEPVVIGTTRAREHFVAAFGATFGARLALDRAAPDARDVAAMILSVNFDALEIEAARQRAHVNFRTLKPDFVALLLKRGMRRSSLRDDLTYLASTAANAVAGVDHRRGVAELPAGFDARAPSANVTTRSTPIAPTRAAAPVPPPPPIAADVAGERSAVDLVETRLPYRDD